MRRSAHTIKTTASVATLIGCLGLFTPLTSALQMMQISQKERNWHLTERKAIALPATKLLEENSPGI